MNDLAHPATIEADETKRRAHELDMEFRASVARIRSEWPTLAANSFAFHAEKCWQVLEFDSLASYLAENAEEVNERHFLRMVEWHRELVEKRQIDPERLKKIPPSRIQEVVPAITSGKMSPEEALSTAEVTPVRDLRELIRDPDAKIDPSKEPVFCPTCNSRVSPDRLNGHQTAPKPPERCTCGHTASRHARYRNPNEGEFWGPCRDCECEGLSVGAKA